MRVAGLAYLAISCLLVSACSTPVTQLGNDTYFVSVQGHGFDTFDDLTADAKEKANQYCGKSGQTAKTSDVKKLENVQREVDVTFTCR